MTCSVPATHLSLEEYWKFLQINECAAYGIRNFPTSGVLGLGCGDYWDQRNRYYLAVAIAKSEKRLKADRWLGFPLRREYNDGNSSARQLPYRLPAMLGKYVRGIGVETNTFIETPTLTLDNAGSPVDPVTFTVNVTFTNENELVIYRPGTLCNIRPESVSIASGVATVTVPRCRLLKSEFLIDYADDVDRPDYETDANFLSTVDVYRNYLNEQTGANLVWWRCKGQIHNQDGVDVCYDPVAACSDVKQLACPYVREQRLGEATFEPATYSSGWSKATYAVGRKPDGLEVNYMRFRYDRYEEMDEDIVRAVIAVAHNNLPRNYCSCDQQTLYYQDDTRPLEPPVRLGLGRSTWGLFEAQEIIRDFDAKTYSSYHGGLF